MNDELVPAPPEADEIDAMLSTDDVDGWVEVHPTVAKWKVVDHGGAEWAMVRYANAERMLTQLTAERAAWIARVDEWFAAAAKPFVRTTTWFDAHLQDYAMRQRDESPRDKKGQPTVKTVALVTGKISTTGHDEKVAIVNDDDVVAWAESAFLTFDEKPEGMPSWEYTGKDNVRRFAVSLVDLDVVKTTKSARIAELRKYVRIVDVEVQDESGDGTPQTIRRVIGPDGEAVPGVEISPAWTSAKVVPNNISEQKEHLHG